MLVMDIFDFEKKLNSLYAIVKKENKAFSFDAEVVSSSQQIFEEMKKAGISDTVSEQYFSRFFIRELTKLINFSYPNLDFDKAQDCISFAKWFDEVRQKGVPNTVVKNLFLRFFSIKKISKRDLNKDEFYSFSGGVYLFNKDIYCIPDIYSFNFHKLDKYAYLDEDEGLVPFCDIDDKTQKTLTSIVKRRMLSLSYAGVEHIELDGESLNICVSRRRIPVRSEKLSHFPKTKIEMVNEGYFNSLWEQEVMAVLKHIKKKKSGQHLFFFGDYTQGLTATIKEMGERIYSIGFAEFGKLAQGHVNFVDMDSVSRETLLEIEKLTTDPLTYFIFISQSVNFTHFYSRINRIFKKSDFIRNWGGHYSKMAIPKLCPHCKKTTSSLSLSYNTIAIVESIDSSYVKGLGCDHCVDGYSGMMFASENVGFEHKDKMTEMIVASTKRTSDDVADQFIRADELSPYVVPELYYKIEGITTVKTLLVSFIKEGYIQAVDAEDVLV